MGLPCPPWVHHPPSTPEGSPTWKFSEPRPLRLCVGVPLGHMVDPLIGHL